jgi:putative ABC transport system permease protein
MRNLFSSPSRFVLTLAGITLGVTSLVVMMSLGAGLQSQIRKQATELGANLVVTPKGWCAYEQVKVLSGNQLPDAIPPEELLKVEQLEGIEVLPYLTVGTAIDNQPVPVTGVRMSGMMAAKGWQLAAGALPSDDSRGVVAGPAIAENFELEPGDAVTIRGVEFEVTGVLEPTGGGDDAVLFIPLGTAMDVYETDGRVSFLGVKVDDLEKLDLYAQRISDVANVSVVSDQQLLASVLSVVNTVGTTLRVIAAVAILTAAFGIINTMLMATFERRREIGILKSIGGSNAMVFRTFVFESGVYGVIGGAVGLIVGVLASQVVTPYVAQNEFTAFIGSADVSVVPPLGDMAVVFVGAVVVSVLAGLYPAWRAARLMPVEAISYE